jgi:hypothetical protein
MPPCPQPPLAGLRYLVALCKDLNRRYDNYEAKLTRLERAAAAQATMMMAAGGDDGAGMYDAPGGSGGDGGYEGGYGDAAAGAGGGGYGYNGSPGGGGVDRPMGAVDDGNRGGFGGGAERFAAPNVAFGSASPGAAGGAGGRRKDEDEDQFADADLSDLLTE